MAGVILENVSRTYPGGTAAVRGVCLEVFDREFLVLVGPSGCGKTTTLRMIAGLEELSGGTISIGGRPVNDVPAKSRDIAMVFQNYALYPHMTVYRNMAFGLELREGAGGLAKLWRWMPVPAKRRELTDRRMSIANRVREAARLLGIEHLLERYPRQLSGGERQRVALGRAIVRNPAVFLFDEPLSNLDAKLRVEMRRELKQLHQRLSATMIYVTHDQVEALTLGDRIVVMNGGQVQQVGTPAEIYQQPANRFVAGFIGTPAMNFVEGNLQRVNGSWVFQRDGWQIALNHQEFELPSGHSPRATLGFRPEDVRLTTDRPPTGGSSRAGRVELVELMGDAAIATVRLEGTANTDHNSSYDSHNDGGLDILSKIDSRQLPAVGQAVFVELDPDRVYLFDVDSGQNLRP